MNNEHTFTKIIFDILSQKFGTSSAEVYRQSDLLQYLNHKTKSVTSGSKSRGAFANHYAIYVLVEDYTNGKFHQTGTYNAYVGAQFSQLFTRQRELPFGSKLQNHALNSRLNEEFKKYHPNAPHPVIIRNLETGRYWINENLLLVNIGNNTLNIAETVLRIIEAYVDAKRDAFEGFINDCVKIQNLQGEDQDAGKIFVESLLRPNVDARIFEIVSYAILKEFYKDQLIFWGWTRDNIQPENLKLYKTGRTNANDGGIDFVMRPLGRFFQVTETLDVKKYFLDIDKVQKFPITFVIKSELTPEAIITNIKDQAQKSFVIDAVVKSYMNAIEEVVNIPILLDMLKKVNKQNSLHEIMNEIVIQSKAEFNHIETETVGEVLATDTIMT